MHVESFGVSEARGVNRAAGGEWGSAVCIVFILELHGNSSAEWKHSTALSSSVAVDKHRCWWEPSCHVQNAVFP